ncbi:electron transfer flavoprotein subunit beta/FixA family protein [Alkalibacter saccharofermentans]|uniref:Electron transfer flavoprotein small subunit n=1 Tax=Alkalibacter saccharofermentans DSM 14828 TaxID=1120975 RepID=A0A1M4UX51_9FIRM|nr:electron transfer flavoprotein subunit beta/FixA family protein [Alkalibacter saccharofermentans]SHE61203.1 electron transfer flavoprotein beta subunit [Alkalibacter saccharofermentans DSM 14828]
MKLICIIKYVPNVDNFNYDFENNTLIRDNIRLMLNADDACAVAYALKVKEKYPEASIEVVTMAPSSVVPHLEDLIRLGVDKAVILSDRTFSGSDTYVTSKILSRYLSKQKFDCILTGTNAVDGDTSHVPAQIAEWLGLDQISGVVDISDINKKSATIVVDKEDASICYEISMPGIISLTRESKYELPYVQKGDMNKEVKSQILMLNANDLNFKKKEVGIEGSLTQVANTYTKHFHKRDKKLVKANDEGVETVFKFLKEKGLIK